MAWRPSWSFCPWYCKHSFAVVTCDLGSVDMGRDDGCCLDWRIGNKSLEASQGIEETVTVVIDGWVDSKALAYRDREIDCLISDSCEVLRLSVSGLLHSHDSTDALLWICATEL